MWNGRTIQGEVLRSKTLTISQRMDGMSAHTDKTTKERKYPDRSRMRRR